MLNPLLRISKWPFFVGDGLMAGLGYLIFAQSKLPMSGWEVVACGLCVALGAACGVWPFLLEYRVFTRLLVAERLGNVSSEIQKLEHFAAQIGAATDRWQHVQDAAEQTARSAKEIAERMAAELKGFGQFMQRANEGERSTLRLEVDKLRRAETEWLQVTIRMLDHVFALHQAGLRSGQSNLIEQLGLFQNSCRESARRVGLTPFVAEPAESFDPQRHQLVDGTTKPEEGALVEETVGAGYTFQGKLLRPALVRVRSNPAGTDAPAPAETVASKDA